MLVIAPGHEPAFFPKTDPLKGPLEARITARSTADIPPKNIIRGRVLDRAGSPMQRAVVSVDMVQQGNTGHGTPPSGTDPLAITDEEGEFALYSKEPFDYMALKVEARAMAPKRFSEIRGGSARRELIVTEGAQLKGRVLSRGKPLESVSVGAVSVDRTLDNFSGDFEYATREDGTFLFPNLPPDRDYFVYGMLKSFVNFGALKARQIHVPGDGMLMDTGDLSVEPGHRLAGKMVLSDKKPLPEGTRLIIGRRDAWDSFTVELPLSGEFEVSNLPAESLTIGGRVNGYRFSGQNASLDRLNPFGLAGRLDSDKTNLVVLLEPGEMLPGQWDSAPEEERPENLPLGGIESGSRRTAWIITGKVISADTKEPINNARVTSGRQQGGRSPWVTWDNTRSALTTNGIFRLELPRGKDQRLLRVAAEGYLPERSEAFSFSNGETIVNFELKKGEGPSGVLLSVNGEPLAGATIYLLGPGEQGVLSNNGQLLTHNVGDEGRTVTSNDGLFTFAARLGDTELYCANAEGFLRVKASEVKPGKKLQLQRWSSVYGLLTRDGKPVSGELLDLRWTEEFDSNRPYVNLHGTVTDDSGNFKIEKVPPGEMIIAVRKELGAGIGGWQSIKLKPFTTAPGQALNLGEIVKNVADQAIR